MMHAPYQPKLLLSAVVTLWSLMNTYRAETDFISCLNKYAPEETCNGKVCQHPEYYCHKYSGDDNHQFNECRKCSSICLESLIYREDERRRCHKDCREFMLRQCMNDVKPECQGGTTTSAGTDEPCSACDTDKVVLYALSMLIGIIVLAVVIFVVFWKLGYIHFGRRHGRRHVNSTQGTTRQVVPGPNHTTVTILSNNHVPGSTPEDQPLIPNGHDAGPSSGPSSRSSVPSRRNVPAGDPRGASGGPPTHVSDTVGGSARGQHHEGDTNLTTPEQESGLEDLGIRSTMTNDDGTAPTTRSSPLTSSLHGPERYAGPVTSSSSNDNPSQDLQFESDGHDRPTGRDRLTADDLPTGPDIPTGRAYAAVHQDNDAGDGHEKVEAKADNPEYPYLRNDPRHRAPDDLSNTCPKK